jgi:ketosteroid isomerase-like protein
MSEENVVRFLKSVEAFNRLVGGPPSVEAGLEFVQFMDPEVRFEPQQAVLQGTYMGRDGVATWLVDLAEHYELGGHIDCPDVRDLGDRVLALGVLSVTGKGSGIEINVPVAILATFRDGLITEFKDFGDKKQALKAAGQSESDG